MQYFQAEAWRAEQVNRLGQVCARLESLWRHKLGSETQISKGGYFISFVHPSNEQWAMKLEHLGVLVRTYPAEQSILRCGVPKADSDWLRLAQAINSLD